ncbi:hypothetical protein HK105_205209 [Polyrhizophydium stewartii]|uniref:MARVEL domain-containing protein n=1 Tax=Polyrhizophydium stewartii TaxID=2732419 RepID=A0ABR4N7B1_9FUNG
MPSFKEIKSKISKGAKNTGTAIKWNFESTITKLRDRTNFQIEKQGRYAARCFQVLLALVSYYWLGSQNADFLTKYNLGSVHGAMLFFAIVSPVISGCMIAIYMLPWFSHAWTSRRILSVETFCDLFMSLGWISGFIVELSAVRGACSIGWLDGCTNFNWLMSWLFFLFVSWSAGLVFDCTAWYRGVCAADEIESDVLLDVRRTTRTRF